MKPLVDILLRSTALGPTSATAPLLLAAVREAAGDAGIVADLTHDGDPREPARLHALFASPGNPERRATILFLHGKGGRAAEWRPDAVRALRLGYNVLVPDLRGHPPSGGERITYGLFEQADMERLLAEAAGRFGIDPARVGADACSMGTLVAIPLAAVTPLAALWLQSPFGDLASMAVQYVHRATLLPPWVVALPTRLALWRIERTTGLPLSSLDPVAAAAKVTCPAVVIHGEEDALVPIRFAPAIFDALAGPKEFWRVPRCGHCHNPDEPQAIRGAEYARRWTAFFTAHLPPGRRGPARLSSGG